MHFNRKTWFFAALCLVACSGSALAGTAYDNFGPGSGGFEFNVNVSWMIAGNSSGFNYVEQAHVFTPSESGYLTDIYLGLGKVLQLNHCTIKLAPDMGTPPSNDDVLETWVLNDLPVLMDGETVRLVSIERPYLTVGLDYWVWISVDDGSSAAWGENVTDATGHIMTYTWDFYEGYIWEDLGDDYWSVGAMRVDVIDPTGLLVTGPGPGEFNPALVRVYPVDADRSFTEWTAYGVDRWGVNVALGELDGTAEPEVLTGAGPGAVFGPHVRGFDIDGTPLPGVSFMAYGTNKYGVNVCSGDLDGDGYDEIVTGAGPGAVFGPHVRGWNWDGSGTPTPIPGISFFAYGTPKWGANVSCGDIDGDGYDEIVTGAGPGAVYGPHVRGWNCDGGSASSIPGVSFIAYGTLKWGVNVACGDIDGDGIDEIVTGAGPGAVFGPHVRAWNWDGTGTAQSIPAVSFFAYDYTDWGANVSCGDLDDDGIDEIITGPGPGETHAPRVRGWNYDGQALTALDSVDFNAFDSTEVTHGVTVGGLRH